MKIHWMSNAPWAATGYGNQTKVFLPRLQKLGHEMSATAFYGLEGAVLNYGGINIYPRGFHPYGLDIAAANAHSEHADIIISLIDAWVLNAGQMQLYNQLWIPWFPVDTEPLCAPVADPVKLAYKRIVFSHHAERMLDQAGLDYYYVPHGIETQKLSPRDRAESRRLMGIPEDAYLVGMVAANKGQPSRKAFCEQIAGFKLLKDQHKDAVLYLHTYDGAGGQKDAIDLTKYLKGMELELNKDVFICNQHQYHLSFGEEYMAHVYSAMDVLMNVSTGEGFGIPIVEAQACGTPVIVGDWTSMGELCFSGRKIDKLNAAPHYLPLGAYQFTPRLEDVGEALVEEYNHPSSKEKAREGALAYDADLVAEKYWKPVLEEIAETIPKGESNMRLVKF